MAVLTSDFAMLAGQWIVAIGLMVEPLGILEITFIMAVFAAATFLFSVLVEMAL